jgi:hypothetical protein
MADWSVSEHRIVITNMVCSYFFYVVESRFPHPQAAKFHDENLSVLSSVVCLPFRIGTESETEDQQYKENPHYGFETEPSIHSAAG